MKSNSYEKESACNPPKPFFVPSFGFSFVVLDTYLLNMLEISSNGGRRPFRRKSQKQLSTNSTGMMCDK